MKCDSDISDDRERDGPGEEACASDIFADDCGADIFDADIVDADIFGDEGSGM